MQFSLDIDECQSNPCKQKCVNVPASFFCDCDNGYKLNDDGRSCGGKKVKLDIVALINRLI